MAGAEHEDPNPVPDRFRQLVRANVADPAATLLQQERTKGIPVSNEVKHVVTGTVLQVISKVLDPRVRQHVDLHGSLHFLYAIQYRLKLLSGLCTSMAPSMASQETSATPSTLRH